eukprot:9477467-Pyramimonas_sp.AAC.1
MAGHRRAAAQAPRLAAEVWDPTAVTLRPCTQVDVRCDGDSRVYPGGARAALSPAARASSA